MVINNPKISICIPIHWMKNWQFFLIRCLESIEKQTFKDYEIIITKAGSMPVNSNRAIQCAKGELVKVLYMDDWLADEYCLEEIVNNFKDEDEWLITGADTNPNPFYTHNIETGNNKLGSPSALTFRNHFEDNLLFDEKLSWMLDCDLYKRLYKKFGFPKLISGERVNIGRHSGQMTHILTNEQKSMEYNYLKDKYGK